MDDPTVQGTRPVDVLKSKACQAGVDILSPEFALVLDDEDPLRKFRQRFCYPKKKGLPASVGCGAGDEECIYLSGNSLGLKPRELDANIQSQLDKWASMGVYVHFEEPLPAALCDRYGRDMMGRLVGADPSCVTLMNGLSVNLHLLLLSFYQPTPDRFKIMIEKHAFPSDRYAMHSQAVLRGFDPREAVLEVTPRESEDTIRTEDIIKLIRDEGPSIAVVCLSGVQYYTGQKFDMELITKEAQKQGCMVGWDLAHAVGNVRIELDKWGVDFACWCTYKYMNSGAGCIAGSYVSKKHESRTAPHLKGWWSNTEDTRFEMLEHCDTAKGIDGFRLCNPSPVLVACVLTSLQIFDEAGMESLLKKQFILTGYLEYLIKEMFNKGEANFVRIITPADPRERGCQLSLIFSCPLQQIHAQLQERGVVCDVRLPYVIRVAPIPLYNSFQDVYNFVRTLQDIFSNSSITNTSEAPGRSI